MADLLTEQEVADRMRCCLKTLRKHIKAGDIRYVLIGKRTKNFTEGDVQEFIENQRRRECPSTNGRNRRTGIMTSGSEVVDIEDLLKSRRVGQSAMQRP